ncbi:PhoH family protein [uncultured Tolumonas sp.]|uniref:PhoH family protein n=1 Tax=uncultured Tolumonas sp. TaxID=263765 RepID=UPI00292EEAD5|nr:PhoH family protein [uncultured Tolumonas sp.]
MVASSKKVFVLDTNVLLHDPQAIFHFQEHDIVIPIVVIEEVDNFKKDQTEVGRNARSISRQMDKLRARGSLSHGVVMDGGGTLKVDVSSYQNEVGFFTLDKHKADNQILACARELLKSRKEKVVLVTKDTNLRIKADAVGLLAEDYTTDKVELDELYTGTAQWDVDPEALDLLYDGGLVPPEDRPLHPNQFVTLVDRTNEAHTALGRYHGREGKVLPLRRMEAPPWGVKPRNREQQFALDLLLDDSIMVVTLLGKAGTGKTLLAIAAGLQQVVDDERYNKLLVSRPVMPMGRDLGFLPGDVEEKLRPYMQPIYDNLDFIVAANMEMRRRSSMTPAQLEEGGYLSVEPLTYIRGRSIPNQYIIVDEAQNLTPHEVKTILTRAGDGTKIVLTGDAYQIDNPYVDASTNGLSYLAEHFKHLDISGHVTLMKGERSTMAELASNLL